MIYKSTLTCRDWYFNFMKALESCVVLDDAGRVMRKPDLFESLYTERGDNLALTLIMNNRHPLYCLAPRGAYDSALMEQEHIIEVTREEITKRAVSMARSMGPINDFDSVIQLMVEGMLDVLENHKEIEKGIKQLV